METQNQNSSKRKGIITLLLFAFMVTGITSISLYKENRRLIDLNKNEKLESESDQLAIYAQIEKNLSEISAHEALLRADFRDDESDVALPVLDRIQNEIVIIADIMVRNNHLIAELNKEVGSKDSKLKQYSTQVANLNRRVKQYISQAEEMSRLQKDLQDSLHFSKEKNNNLHLALDDKKVEIQQQYRIILAQNDEISAKNEAIQTTYFVVGSFQDLKKKNVLEKEGGIIGIGSIKKLKSDFDKSAFIKVNRESYKTIPVFSTEAHLVTNHNPDSYEWEVKNEMIQWLRIKDYELFWENSKYLVIVTNEDRESNLSSID